MSEHTSDDELAQLKRIWLEYGAPLLLGLVVALVAVFGYRWWTGHNQSTAEAASTLYEQVLELTLQTQGESLTKEQQAALSQLTAQLKDDYSGTAYAAYGALFEAKQAVEKGDLAQAQSLLEWVVDKHGKESIGDLARLRLARVLVAEDTKQADEALKLLEQGPAGPFAASYAATEGDIYVALKQPEKAREAYHKALDLARQQGEPLPVVQTKLDDLAVQHHGGVNGDAQSQ